jgi:ribosomal protein S18 acetylase RimI-like enzyme
MEQVAHFFAEVIARDPSYVSHGEIQTGLSSDGVHWDDDLDAKFVEDLQDPGPDRSIAVAHRDGRIAGALIALWVTSERMSYMVIEDLAVDPAFRGSGLGAELVAFTAAEGVRRGMTWSFLESGLQNHGAHAFFERHGFTPVSKVFAKRL